MDKELGNLIEWARGVGYDPSRIYGIGAKPDPLRLSAHFHADEFRCNCCGRLHPSGKMPPEQLIEWLEAIRNHFDKPVHINSGYRCPKHNAAVGGALHSRHKMGVAADIWIEGVDPQHVYDFCDDLVGAYGGVGNYPTFTHVDFDPIKGKRRWK